jgi:hypothetical protein
MAGIASPRTIIPGEALKKSLKNKALTPERSMPRSGFVAVQRRSNSGSDMAIHSPAVQPQFSPRKTNDRRNRNSTDHRATGNRLGQPFIVEHRPGVVT